MVAAHELAEAVLCFLKVLRLFAASDESRSRGPGRDIAANQSTHEPILFTPREAAKALRISEKTLWSMTVPRGPIPSVRLGRSVRYSADVLRNAVSQSKLN
jgi:hypothetical protein